MRIKRIFKRYNLYRNAGLLMMLISIVISRLLPNLGILITADSVSGFRFIHYSLIGYLAGLILFLYGIIKLSKVRKKSLISIIMKVIALLAFFLILNLVFPYSQVTKKIGIIALIVGCGWFLVWLKKD